MTVASAGDGIINFGSNPQHAGTLGGPVLDRRGELAILTCFHCIYAPGFEWHSRTVSTSHPYASINDGSAFKKFGKIDDVLRDEFVDVALIKPLEGNSIDQDIAGWGQVTGIRQLNNNEKNNVWLKKVGFKSEITYGLFTDFQPYFGDYYGQLKMFYLHDLIKIESRATKPFSEVGDSGSFVLDIENQVVGIIVMGEGNTSYAIKADYIEDHFKIKFVL